MPSSQCSSLHLNDHFQSGLSTQRSQGSLQSLNSPFEIERLKNGLGVHTVHEKRKYSRGWGGERGVGLALLFSRAAAECWSLGLKQCWHLVLSKMLASNLRHLDTPVILSLTGSYIWNREDTVSPIYIGTSIGYLWGSVPGQIKPSVHCTVKGCLRFQWKMTKLCYARSLRL